MATRRISLILAILCAILLPLCAASPVQAQAMVYPVYGPWGVYYVPYTPTYPGPVSPPPASASSSTGVVRTSASYGAQAGGSDSRPSYYSEDYSGPQGPASEPSKLAYIRVRVPANAELWINNERRTQTGSVRQFKTPALDPDYVYVYHVKARWVEDGGISVEKTLRVRTISGTRVTVNFVRPPESQPRPAARPTVAATPTRSASQVEQRPVSWTSGSVAPRSLPGPK